MPEWIGRWDGGRILRGPDGPHYVIERMRGGTRYALSLGPVSEVEARAKLAEFLRDPVGFGERHRLRFTAPEPRRPAITDELLERFARHMGEQRLTKNYRSNVLLYLGEWAEALKGRAWSALHLADLHRELDRWDTAKRHRIVALKAYTAFLRTKGELSTADDPTVNLPAIQGRAPSAVEREGKTYSVEQLEATYRHIPEQYQRDVFRVRVLTGMHVTEIRRVAAGKGVVADVKGGGEIAGTVTFPHKIGRDHTLSVDAGVLAAVRRMIVRGVAGELRNEDLALAGRAGGVKPVRIGNLRHTFVTLAVRVGRLVTPPGGGVALDVVAQIVGHRSIATTERFYLGTHVPPMIVIPVNLEHDDERRGGR